jgi:hypothetical protein
VAVVEPVVMAPKTLQDLVGLSIQEMARVFIMQVVVEVELGLVVITVRVVLVEAALL